MTGRNAVDIGGWTASTRSLRPAAKWVDVSQFNNSDEEEGVLRALRQAVEEPAAAFASRATSLEALQGAVDRDPAAQAELGPALTAYTQAKDPVLLSVAAAKLMRLLLQRQAAEQEAAPQVSRSVARKERRQKAMERDQKAALASARRGVLSELEQPVETLPGVGARVGILLRNRGLAQVVDLVWFLPLGYRDERTVMSLSELTEGQYAVSSGVVTQVRGGRVGEVILQGDDGRGSLRLCWFRASRAMLSRYRPGVRLRVSGVVEAFRGQLQLTHPRVEMLLEGAAAQGNGVVPRYSEVPGVAPRVLQKAILAALDRTQAVIPEAVPASTLAVEGLPSLAAALRALHVPLQGMDDGALAALQEQRSPAHRRLAYEEFFLLELSLHQRRIDEQGVLAEPLRAREAPMARARAAFGFELTAAQERVFSEIARDLESEQPMRRLVQGDVGSGKTAVAMLAAAHAVSAGAQVAFMAPTEVLAEQHFRSLSKVMEALSLRAALLLGGARAGHRRQVLKGLAEGTIDLAIGTHALLSEGVDFNRLRLVIVDEQHRFGVSQRLRLVQKGGDVAPHLLVMTATPIPRSLTLALHGDLAGSVIDEKPKGRLSTVTRAYPAQERERALRQLERALASGGQAYVVCPAIEESEDQPLRTAEEVFRELGGRLSSYGVALLHGRLSPEEKAEAMNRFLRGDAKVLVATTVIEVGVDVAAANVILIEHAERFGMAQLHQLRGRVGRAGQRSACLLVHEAKGEDARERLRVLCETDDGFVIAEEDLRLRGPGELFGRKQSGMPGFRFGDLRRDGELLARARNAAAEVLAKDPELHKPEHRGARDALAQAYALGGGIVKEEAG